MARYLRAAGWPGAATMRGLYGRDGAEQTTDVIWAWGVSTEVKDVAASAWPSWCRQAAAQAAALAQLPVVIRRERGVADVGSWPCRWRVAEALDLGLDLDPDTTHLVDGEQWGAAPFAALVAAIATHENRPTAIPTGADERHERPLR